MSLKVAIHHMVTMLKASPFSDSPCKKFPTKLMNLDKVQSNSWSSKNLKSLEDKLELKSH